MIHDHIDAEAKLRPTIIRSACLGVRPFFGANEQSFLFFSSFENFLILKLGASLKKEHICH
jgi:hypothetical protein